MTPAEVATLQTGDKVRSMTGRIGKVYRIVNRTGYADIEALIIDGPDKGRDIVFRSDLVEVHQKGTP